MIKQYQSLTGFSEQQIEYIIQNFSKTSCRKIATYLNSKTNKNLIEILPSRVFSIAKFARFSAEKKIQKLIESGELNKAEEIQLKLDLLLPKSKVGR